jgi:AbrB family looped-hinge helix DNA binding protein
MLAFMTGSQDLTGQATVTPEGRVLIPAEFRRRLGLEPGDKIRLALTADGLSIVSARTMTHALWANNHGGDAADTSWEVRAARDADQVDEASKWQRVDEGGDVEGDLLASLGLK